jgi:hypothetical protein
LTAALRMREGFAIVSLVGPPVEPFADFCAFFPGFIGADHEGIVLRREQYAEIKSEQAQNALPPLGRFLGVSPIYSLQLLTYDKKFR